MKTTVAKAAKAIKAELKKAYPGVKFSVTSENFSMGNAVRIYYTDGPISSNIQKLVSKYQYGSFNGMEDIYEYDNVNKDISQAKYVTTERRMSESTKAIIIESLTKKYGTFELNSFNANTGELGHYVVRKEFEKLSL